jgi:hypothetical protein
VPAATLDGCPASPSGGGGAASGGGGSGAAGSSGPLTPLPAVTASEIKALLLGAITPRGSSAKIAALLKAKAYKLTFKALTAGSALVSWYYLPKGARLAKAKPVLIASGRRAFASAGRAKIAIKLTAAGRRMLKHAKRLKLTAKATFTPTGKTGVTATKKLTLKR